MRCPIRPCETPSLSYPTQGQRGERVRDHIGERATCPEPARGQLLANDELSNALPCDAERLGNESSANELCRLRGQNSHARSPHPTLELRRTLARVRRHPPAGSR
jgi:hypothetical protein